MSCFHTAALQRVQQKTCTSISCLFDRVCVFAFNNFDIKMNQFKPTVGGRLFPCSDTGTPTTCPSSKHAHLNNTLTRGAKSFRPSWGHFPPDWEQLTLILLLFYSCPFVRLKLPFSIEIVIILCLWTHVVYLEIRNRFSRTGWPSTIFFFINIIVMVFHLLNYVTFCVLHHAIPYQPLFAVLNLLNIWSFFSPKKR